jgi:hypothetical protein
VDGPVEIPMATGMVAIDGIAKGSLQVDYHASAEDLTGAGIIDGQELFALTHDGIVWIGPCE